MSETGNDFVLFPPGMTDEQKAAFRRAVAATLNCPKLAINALIAPKGNSK